MKENVDLTENRDFRKPRNLSSLTNSLLGIKFPWSKSELSPYHYDNEIVFTGTKENRKSKMKWIPYEEGFECEMCGINHSNTPWKMVLTLCQRCDEELERDHVKKNDLILSNLK